MDDTVEETHVCLTCWALTSTPKSLMKDLPLCHDNHICRYCHLLLKAVIRGGGGGRDTKWSDVHQHFLLVTSVNRSRLSQHVMSGVYMRTHTCTHTGNGEGEREQILKVQKDFTHQKKEFWSSEHCSEGMSVTVSDVCRILCSGVQPHSEGG